MQITRQSTDRVRITGHRAFRSFSLTDDELELLAQAIADFQFSEEDS